MFYMQVIAGQPVEFVSGIRMRDATQVVLARFRNRPETVQIDKMQQTTVLCV